METVDQVPKRPMVFYQMSTTNQSFLNMHYILKSLGVKNNRFMLALLDPDLAGVSPFDPNLNQMMKRKIFVEVMNNYWYFLREVVRVPSPGIPGGVPYQLHRGNLALNFCMMYNFNIFLELPRQQGKTMSAICRYLWIYNFGTTDSEITFLNKKMDDSKLNLQRLKDIRDLLPSYLRMDQAYSFNNKKIKAPSTVESVKNPSNRNIIRTAPSARSAILATNLLRGRTLPVLWGDEWAFIPYNEDIYLGAVPAYKTASLNAKRMGKPYGILITTTPGILTTNEGIAANRMRMNATPFSEIWYDMTYDEIMSVLNANEMSNFIYIKYTYQQIGRDEKWFTDICKDLEWNWDAIRREVLLEWSENPENSPFNREDLECVSRLVHPPVDVKPIKIFNRTYMLNIYDNTIPLRADYTPKYPPIIGVDVSGGYNRDASAITIIDSRTTRVIADFKNNSINTNDLARVIYQIVTKYYQNAVINIERNGVAEAISA
nr:MAG TPA: large terminase [Caudoviricetes sp.]